ncbi:MAG: ABC-F type ribosomal protection protein [Clostridia bacterium]|nr:ABC-F type ribosomal protection protein [Clostridia bacterium]
MLILEAENIKKYYGERLITGLERFKLYESDRVGIVGLNGSGKTTLMNILTKQTEPDEGSVVIHTNYTIIRQLEEDEELKQMAMSDNNDLIFREFDIDGINIAYASGGEKTRLKIASGLSAVSSVIFADEPTCNLDIKGVQLLEEKLKAFQGAIVIISHDRTLMDNICNKILEVENGRVKLYEGNYTAYRTRKEAERERQLFEYEQYTREKRKLEDAMDGLRNKVKTMRKAPARMGNSEARLHKRRVNGKKARLDKSVKAMETRINQLEIKERPRDLPKARIDIQEGSMPVSKTVISAKDLWKSFGSRKLFDGVNFDIPNGSKVALVGDNGSGKTTLLNMILEGTEGIRIANGVKIGYFSQNHDILDADRTILENVLKVSIFPEYFVRTVLARLLFKKDDVYKKIEQLSGGERVKVAFARIFVQDINLLIMDEPTNYLDIYSMEALEGVLREFEGTILFVSHDRRFVEKVAGYILALQDGKVVKIGQGMAQYFQGDTKKNKNMKNVNSQKHEMERIMLLENRLSSLNGRLCMPSKTDNVEALNAEYIKTANELKTIKEGMKAAR